MCNLQICIRNGNDIGIIINVDRLHGFTTGQFIGHFYCIKSTLNVDGSIFR